MADMFIVMAYIVIEGGGGSGAEGTVAMCSSCVHRCDRQLAKQTNRNVLPQPVP